MNNIKIYIGILFCAGAALIFIILMNSNDDVEHATQDESGNSVATESYREEPNRWDEEKQEAPNQPLIKESLIDQALTTDIDLVDAGVAIDSTLRKEITTAINEAFVRLDNAKAPINVNDVNIDDILEKLAGLIKDNQEAADFLSEELSDRFDSADREAYQDMILEMMFVVPPEKTNR